MSNFADLLPPHKCSLSLEHNPHRASHQSVANWETTLLEIGSWTLDDWVSPEQRSKAIETDAFWELQWYPDTPVGFIRLLACDLDVLLTAAREGEHKK